MYGNTYTLDKVMMDLTNSIFQADAKTAVNTVRQNLQVAYVSRLIKMLDPQNNQNIVVRSMTLSELKRIDQMMSTGVSPDALTKAHRDHVRLLIKLAMEGGK
jgi:DNA-binding sugar fermentation-stimulating protein